jgi:hypothetical protein
MSHQNLMLNVIPDGKFRLMNKKEIKKYRHEKIYSPKHSVHFFVDLYHGTGKKGT